MGGGGGGGEWGNFFPFPLGGHAGKHMTSTSSLNVYDIVLCHTRLHSILKKYNKLNIIMYSSPQYYFQLN